MPYCLLCTCCVGIYRVKWVLKTQTHLCTKAYSATQAEPVLARDVDIQQGYPAIGCWTMHFRADSALTRALVSTSTGRTWACTYSLVNGKSIVWVVYILFGHVFLDFIAVQVVLDLRRAARWLRMSHLSHLLVHTEKFVKNRQIICWARKCWIYVLA
jgi:hypothetical protein